MVSRYIVRWNVALLVGVAAISIGLAAQTAAPTGDFRNAVTAEVRDAQNQVVLSGRFEMSDEDDDDVERRATLEPTGVDTDATGEAEVEFDRESSAEQEVEFSVRNLAPDAQFTFVIDGVDVATATTNSRGAAETEADVSLPGASVP